MYKKLDMKFSFNISYLMFVDVKKLNEKDVLMSENEYDDKGTLYSRN